MDLAHLHLLSNHFPVIGVIFGVVVLAWGIFRRSDEVKSVGLITLILAGIVAVPVYLTGEPAEEIIEKLPGVSEAIIELHEDSALISLIFAMVAGAFALLALISNRLKWATFARFSVLGTILVSLFAAVLMARTANLGGQIRHSEIRASGQTISEGQQPADNKTGRKDNDGDDDD
jgi:uncharacterized membrane protein